MWAGVGSKTAVAQPRGSDEEATFKVFVELPLPMRKGVATETEAKLTPCGVLVEEYQLPKSVVEREEAVIFRDPRFPEGIVCRVQHGAEAATCCREAGCVACEGELDADSGDDFWRQGAERRRHGLFDSALSKREDGKRAAALSVISKET